MENTLSHVSLKNEVLGKNGCLIECIIKEKGEQSLLWNDFQECSQKWEYPWIVGGNFSMVLNSYERIENHCSRSCAYECKKLWT